MLRNLNRITGGRRILGVPQDGILAADIIAQTSAGDFGPGLLYDEALARPGQRLRLRVTGWPAAGAAFVAENGALDFTAAPGQYTLAYNVFADNVLVGSDAATINLGVAPGAALTGTGAIAGGSASGDAGNALAPGAALTGGGAITGGAAGGIAADAPGGVGTGSGSGSGGEGAGGGAGAGGAPGGAGTSLGSGSGGGATGGAPIIPWAVLPEKRTESRRCKIMNWEVCRTMNIITPPAALPVSVQEVKDAGARVDGSEMDLQIDLAIRAMTDKAEAILHRPLITRTYELVLDRFPACEIDLQVPNVSAVESVAYLDENGAIQSAPAGQWAVLGETLTTWLFNAFGTTWPATRDIAGAVRIRFNAGFGAAGASVPDSIRLWIIANVIANLDNPSGVRAGEWKTLAYTDALLDCWKTYRN